MQRPVSLRGTGLDLVRTVEQLRAALCAARTRARGHGRARVRRSRGGRAAVVGLVPTMGALHDGHLSLIRRARAECDVVVVSIFVNPAQFNEQADLAAYPRDERRDVELARRAGADVLFVPSVQAVYPSGFATSVMVGGVSERLEGAVRGPSHFGGVATVVAKLLNMAGPDRAYFGQKDAQQVAVIRSLVRDLDIPVEVVVCPTVREPDGLAASSRNVRLDAAQREQARALHKALEAARRRAAEGERDSARLLASAEATIAEWSVEPEYVELVDPETFQTLPVLDREGLLLIAARLGETRLIDNIILAPQRAENRKAPAPEGALATGTESGPEDPKERTATVCSA
ncbi:MAG: pantoate--beta-alanine ligase [Acidobacteriota bacterium]|nr:pantoate--beta-alanine ligase [Acidobacteriota bacterium]